MWKCTKSLFRGVFLDKIQNLFSGIFETYVHACVHQYIYMCTPQPLDLYSLEDLHRKILYSQGEGEVEHDHQRYGTCERDLF